ncbi:aKG-HExxH-type peptide beta-hydroxylase [Streptomyces sp. NPDC056663]|uniref:aKG-HExxH-type peptide beta-hydroxylase n=1 Tax=Streptomyces sp. NPDC056663 TaxID=3345899 RepID=UPI0036B2680E
MTSAVPDRFLRELGRTEGGSEALDLLARDQHTRRLASLRALLDAAGRAPADVCPGDLLDRLHDHWTLLAAAERADRDAVRSVLFYPLVGPWVRGCLYGLLSGRGGPVLRADLSHLGAIAAAGAIRAGLPFTARLSVATTRLPLPTLGSLHTCSGEADLRFDGERLTVRQKGAMDLVVRFVGRTAEPADPRWLPLLILPALMAGGVPVPLDDLDPYRTSGSGQRRHGLGDAAPRDTGEQGAWAASWLRVTPLLRIGGAHRIAEAAALLRCLVPLTPPPGSDGAAHCSGTRREAFGAVLSSRPDSPALLASTLVHELQHTKLAALAMLVPLHREDATPRHFAPWRPDPRPFDGLLQGAYAHLALADFWQRCALGAQSARLRDLAWTEHTRCREQTGAVLPVLAGSGALTPEGRVVVNELITLYHRLADCPPPAGHLTRARAYVSTARVIWQQRNDSGRV